MKQLIRLETEYLTDDFLLLLEILSDLPRPVWEQTREKDFETKLMPLLKWVKQKVNFASLPPPGSLTIGKKKYKIPDLTEKTLGCKIQLQNLVSELAEKKAAYTVACLRACAIVYTDEHFGEWDSEKTSEMETVIQKSSCMEVFALGNFFLRKLIRS